MKVRMLTACVVVGLAACLSLTSLRNCNAREVQVPAEIKPNAPETQVKEVTAVVAAEMPVEKETASILFVNSRRIRLNYSVSEVGPSGVAAIELWATRDGKTWARYSNEPPPPGPLVVHVAEEGRYGFSIVVRSGTGLASQAPESGDAPQIWVDVDETRPVVKLHDIRVVKHNDSHHLQIGYSAKDKYLTAKPVTLYMAENKEGPWTPIASHLDSTGVHTWDIPRDVPYQFYVRAEAKDLAGNYGSSVCVDPVKVDLSRPKGTILGVETENKTEIKATPVSQPISGWIR